MRRKTSTYMLDGHDLARRAVDGLVDGAKTAGAELLEDGILACHGAFRRHRGGGLSRVAG